MTPSAGRAVDPKAREVYLLAYREARRRDWDEASSRRVAERAVEELQRRRGRGVQVAERLARPSVGTQALLAPVAGVMGFGAGVESALGGLAQMAAPLVPERFRPRIQAGRAAIAHRAEQVAREVPQAPITSAVYGLGEFTGLAMPATVAATAGGVGGMPATAGIFGSAAGLGAAARGEPPGRIAWETAKYGTLGALSVPLAGRLGGVLGQAGRRLTPRLGRAGEIVGQSVAVGSALGAGEGAETYYRTRDPLAAIRVAGQTAATLAALGAIGLVKPGTYARPGAPKEPGPLPQVTREEAEALARGLRERFGAETPVEEPPPGPLRRPVPADVPTPPPRVWQEELPEVTGVGGEPSAVEFLRGLAEAAGPTGGIAPPPVAPAAVSRPAAAPEPTVRPTAQARGRPAVKSGRYWSSPAGVEEIQQALGQTEGIPAAALGLLQRHYGPSAPSLALVESVARTPARPRGPQPEAAPEEPPRVTPEQPAAEPLAERTTAPGEALSEEELRSLPTGPQVPRGQPPERVPFALSLGRETEVRTIPGSAAQARWALVEAADVVPSHTIYLARRPDFPATRQVRQRGRKAMLEQVLQMERSLQPEQLLDYPLATEGAPVVDENGRVVAGNGRAITIQRWYEKGGPEAEAYRRTIAERAEALGLDRAAVESARQPVLVRVSRWPDERAATAFARDSDVASTAARSPVEVAQSDAERLDRRVLSLWQDNPDGSPNTAANLDFRRAFIERVVPSPNERAQIVTASGELNADGVKRLRNALFAKAYGNTRLNDWLMESADEAVRQPLLGALRAAPRVAQVKEEIAAGRLPDLDISADLARALGEYVSLRRRGMTVDNLASQPGLFERTPGRIVELMRFIERNRRSARAIAEGIRRYYDAVEAQGSPEQRALFAAASPTPDDILARVLEGEQTRTAALIGSEAGFARIPVREINDLAKRLVEAVKEGRLRDAQMLYQAMLSRGAWPREREETPAALRRRLARAERHPDQMAFGPETLERIGGPRVPGERRVVGEQMALPMGPTPPTRPLAGRRAARPVPTVRPAPTQPELRPIRQEAPSAAEGEGPLSRATQREWKPTGWTIEQRRAAWAQQARRAYRADVERVTRDPERQQHMLDVLANYASATGEMPPWSEAYDIVRLHDEMIARGDVPRWLERGAFRLPTREDVIEAAQRLREALRLRRPDAGAPGRRDLEDMLRVGQYLMQQGITDKDRWQRRMRAMLGPGVVPHLDDLYASTRLILARGEPMPEDPVSTLVRMIERAKRLTPERLKAVGELRRRQAGAAGAMLRRYTGKEAAQRALGAMKGEARMPQFEPLEPLLSPEQVHELFERIRTTPNLRPDAVFARAQAFKALFDLLEGRLPEPSRLRLLELIYGPKFTRAIRGKLPLTTAGRVWREVVDLLNLPRALRASVDLSAAMRQGALLGVSFPREWADAFRAQLHALVSEGAMRDIHLDITTHRWFDLATQAGLYVAPWREAAALSAREEAFISRLGSRLPWVRVSERAYVTFLNKLRFDVFARLMDAIEAGGKAPTLEEATAIARTINAASGRGTLGDLEGAGATLAALLWSPRYLTSRFQILAQALSGPSVQRKLAASVVAKWIAANLSLLALLDYSGLAEVELDPRSADFLKARIGRTRFDVWTGYQQIIRHIAQATTGIKSAETGYVRPLRRGERLDVLLRFARSKASPAVALAWDWASGRDYIGVELNYDMETLRELSLQQIVPMAVEDAWEAFQYENGTLGAIAAAASTLGVGVVTYRERTPEEWRRWVKRMSKPERAALRARLATGR